MPTFHRAVRASLASAHYAGVELQISVLELAHTRLDRADLAWDAHTVRRAHHDARRRYESVVKYLGKLQATEEQERRIRARLTALAARLMNSPHPMCASA